MNTHEEGWFEFGKREPIWLTGEASADARHGPIAGSGLLSSRGVCPGLEARAARPWHAGRWRWGGLASFEK